MKILYIAVEAIYPTNTGSRIRAYQLVKALSQKHEVGLAYISAETMVNTGEVHCQYVEQIKLNTPLAQLSKLKKARLLLTGISKNSFPLSEYYIGRQQIEPILRLVKDKQPEVIVLQSSYILSLATHLRRLLPSSCVILDAHNVESMLQKRMAITSSSTIMKPVKKFLANNLAKLEKRADTFVSGIAAVSTEEANWFKSHNTQALVAVVPNGVDIEYFRSNDNLPAKPVIAFCGSMSYLPNYEGAMWFAEKVWPLIIAAIPGAEWLIIGKDPPQSVVDLATDPRITVTGTVDDVRVWLERSRISVVPLLSGGGTRLKILEAMSMKRTIVSTNLGAEGIAESEGIIRVDEPREMAETIVNLLRNNNLENLGRMNRSLAVEQYSWTSIGLRMIELVESCQEEKTAGT